MDLGQTFALKNIEKNLEGIDDNVENEENLNQDQLGKINSNLLTTANIIIGSKNTVTR